ncbi:MAG: hypothetical protein KBC91_04620 [Candidatus Omnitrophica bacterium]|nr:hypothetical protein [Candidatus Omnitrophota bacterium]
MKKGHDGSVFGVYFLVSLAVYFLSLKNFFINDDLIHLDFVKNFKGHYLDFLLPNVRPSDVVTHARYEPFHLYFYAVLFQILGDFFPAYQLLNIAAHSLNAFLIYKIAKKAGIQEGGAFLAALFFCVYRLNSQSVLWYASLFCTAAVTLLLGAFLLFLRGDRKSLFYSVLLYLGAALLTLRAPQYVLLTGACLWFFREESMRDGSQNRKIRAFGGYAAVSLFSAIGNLISWRYFPNDIPGFEFDFFSLYAFFLNLVFPYESGLFFKTAVLFLFCGVVILHRKDRVTAFLTAAISLNAVFWFLIFSAGHLPYAPRYSYLASALFCLLMGHWLNLAVQGGAALRRWGASVLMIVFTCGNAYLVISQDIVWFKFLSVRGQKLNAIAHLDGTGKRKVFIRDDFFSGDPNLNYFKDRIDFAAAPPGSESGVFIVDLERDKYVKYFGRDFGREYWHQPWFVKKECDESTPWC